MMRGVYVIVTNEHSGDGCDLASTLCKYDLRKGDLIVLSWAMNDATNEAGKYLFRAANV